MRAARDLASQHLCSRHRALEAAVHFFPVDVGEESVDVLGARGSKIDLVSVLVHIEHEQRCRGREGLRVMARPRGAKIAGEQLQLEDGPAATATQPVAECSKMLLPA